MRIEKTTTLLLGMLTVAVACSDATTEPSDDDSAQGGSAQGGNAEGGNGQGGMAGGGGAAPFSMTSSAFREGGVIPLEFECGAPAPVMGPGDNMTPPLSWTAGPEGTQSYAIVVRDIDATVPQFPEGIIHWVIYDIPADATSLPGGVPPGYELGSPAGAKQAEIQGSNFFGYFGPCSPNSVNTYVFTVHAMGDAALPGVTMATSEADVAAQVETTSIASASLSGES